MAEKQLQTGYDYVIFNVIVGGTQGGKGMFAGKRSKLVFGVFAVLVLVLCTLVFSLSEVLMPVASGKKVLKADKLTVDASNADQGYIMVKGPKTKTKMKVTVWLRREASHYAGDFAGFEVVLNYFLQEIKLFLLFHTICCYLELANIVIRADYFYFCIAKRTTDGKINDRLRQSRGTAGKRKAHY